ncbi:hypothetical protein FB470_005496 [Amycolatopsis thermophila]|uniref:Uncharacterized protein n=1 Tax=Amycolatopsis thermophila TaxID=206084 RepID=A0ABU0F395_9PSEU|nr:hypothetical protein [Amycolatopsis thermophila]
MPAKLACEPSSPVAELRTATGRLTSVHRTHSRS